MNKKIIRVFISVYFILAMTTTTAFASSSHFIWHLTSQDRLVHHSVSNSNAIINGTVTIKRNYEEGGKPYIIELSNILIRGKNVDASEYDYGIYYWDDDDKDTVELSLARGNDDIGYIRFHVSPKGKLNVTHHNY